MNPITSLVTRTQDWLTHLPLLTKQVYSVDPSCNVPVEYAHSFVPHVMFWETLYRGSWPYRILQCTMRCRKRTVVLTSPQHMKALSSLSEFPLSLEPSIIGRKPSLRAGTFHLESNPALQGDAFSLCGDNYASCWHRAQRNDSALFECLPGHMEGTNLQASTQSSPNNLQPLLSTFRKLPTQHEKLIAGRLDHKLLFRSNGTPYSPCSRI